MRLSYLANPAGMFHGQTSAGHCCSYISFQIDHNSSHCVQAPGAVLLDHSPVARRRQTLPTAGG
ncbi:hypothetical protein EYF80_015422 [Liparis tanakae]|uniref:Uncharacterized protein n=1 Tax=Liparis tanakae TaxID=230148 RepID=A0A4Z2I8F8_9TELE|nr:hypothetical protein EYF80_015422 [Liparis tanakae]